VFRSTAVVGFDQGVNMHQTESSSASRPRRLGTRLAAIAAFLAVLGSALVVGAPAQAAAVDPGLPTAPATSVAISPWTPAGSSAAAPLPSNLAGLGIVSIQAPGQTISLQSGTTNTTIAADPVPVTGCLGANTAEGFTAQCRTNTATVTFDHPVANPFVALAPSWRYDSTNSVQCTASWQDTTFTAVNGVPTGASQIEPVTPIDPSQNSFVNNRLSLLPSFPQSIPCAGGQPTWTYFRVDGLVSTVTFTYTSMETITRNTPGTPLPDPAGTSTGVYTAWYLPAADLSVAKTGPATVQAGAPVSWQITVTNQGGANSTGFIVHDAVPAGVTSPVIASSPPGCALTGNDLLCSAAPSGWTVSQNPSVSTVVDLSGGDAQSLVPSVLDSGATFGPIVITGTAPTTPTTLGNSVSVSGSDVDVDTSNNTSTVTTDVTAAPAAITLAKSGALAAGASGAAGDTVNYTFSAENTGTSALTNVSIADPLPGLSALTYTWPGVPGTLLPGQTVTATATYVLTQADVSAGSVVNTATATGDDPAGDPVTDSDTATVSVPASPAIALTKTGGLAAGATGAVGDTVNYSFAAQNIGNVALTNVSIADPLPGLSALTYTWPGTPGTLLPGQTVTATATYVLTQADVNAGSVVNTATATGDDPTGDPVTGDDTTTVDVPQGAAIALTKTGGLAAGATGAVGDTVDYSFSAQNTGNVVLTNVSIADPLPGLSALTYTWPGTPGTLLPGQTVTATATYVLTQADVNAGSVVNTATVTGDDPTGDPVTGDDTTTVDVPQAPGISLVKTGGLAAGATGAVGDVVDFHFAATNTGNVPLAQVTITDTMAGLSALTYSWPGTPGDLAPGQVVTATASYQLTQADVDNGSVANSATATGLDPAGDPVDDVSTTRVPLDPAPGLSLTKTGALAAGAAGTVGDTVDYGFTATNTGNVTLTGVSISDPLPGLSAISYSWPGTPGTLTPGQSATATATYVLTAADVRAGTVSNTATVTGDDPRGGDPITATSNRVVVALGVLAETGSTVGWSVFLASLSGVALILLGLTLWFTQVVNRRRKAAE
jgi:uncharacterized repeat protein (TIGR01451 family)